MLRALYVELLFVIEVILFLFNQSCLNCLILFV